MLRTSSNEDVERSSIAKPAVVAPKQTAPSKPKRAATPKADKQALLTCPRCKQGTLITGSRGWGCDRWRDGCRFVIWFDTAGRRLTAAQLRELVGKGKTRKAKFTDAGGKPVEARLVLDVNADGGTRLE